MGLVWVWRVASKYQPQCPVVTSVINVHAMWGQVTGHCDQAIVPGNYKRIYSSPALMDYNSYKNWKYIEWSGPRVEEVRSVKVK